MENKNNINDDESSSNPLWQIWNIAEVFKIPNTNFTIKGFSVAALRTNFYIKELNIMLDAGISSPYGAEHIFVTHGHADHCANLPFQIYSKKENKKIQVYSPKQTTNYIKSFIQSAYILSSDCDIGSLNIKDDELYLYSYYDNVSVCPGDKFDINIKKKPYTVEVIQCYHSVPCVGYGFSEKRMKLKDEYKNLNGKDIQELRKKGVEVSSEVELPFFLFLGDTNKEILKNEDIKKYKTIMIECTFLYDDDLNQADKTFHIHWRHIEEYIIENKDIFFILFHFSQRYKKKDLIEFFSKIKLNNIIPWIH
jgi:ribonuclease Z